MAVEGKTILQTPERTELTGKEGIPFQDGGRNGHVLLERIREYSQTEVVDDLTSDDSEKALSAAQGKVLNDKIAEISNPASADKDGLMSKEDKKAFDSIRFSEDENSIWFNGKKYGATLFKNLFGLSTGSSNEEIKTALGGNTYNDISQMVDRGILFLNINNKALQHVMIRIENTGSSEGDYLHIRGLSDASDTAYIKIRHYNGTFSIPSAVKRDNLLFKSGIVNVLDSSASDLPLSAAMGKQLNNGKISRSEIVNDLDSNNSGKPLSAAMGKELNDKIEAIKSEISALRDEIEALKGSGA